MIPKKTKITTKKIDKEKPKKHTKGSNYKKMK